MPAIQPIVLTDDSDVTRITFNPVSKNGNVATYKAGGVNTSGSAVDDEILNIESNVMGNGMHKTLIRLKVPAAHESFVDNHVPSRNHDSFIRVEMKTSDIAGSSDLVRIIEHLKSLAKHADILACVSGREGMY